MGKLIVRVDLETVNFDKFCCRVLDIVHVRRRKLDDVVIVTEGDHDIDFDGSDPEVREYKKHGFRSMTEMFAIRTRLGRTDAAGRTLVKGDDIRGLASLCRSLAENHGKVKDVNGGSLYRKGTIPTFARSLIMVPERAPEIAMRLMKAIAISLNDEHPVMSLAAANDRSWNDVASALDEADRRVGDLARSVAHDLYEDRCEIGGTFKLAKAPEPTVPTHGPVLGIVLRTRNPNLVRHLWYALKPREPFFRIATIVAVHPDTGRIAVTCSNQHDLDIRPVVDALELTFGPKTGGGTDFDVNAERRTIVWDRRFAEGLQPTAEDVARIVGERMTFHKEVKSAYVGATLADAFSAKQSQKQQKRR